MIRMAKVDLLYDEAIRLRDAGDLPAAADKLREILGIDPRHILTHSALAVMLQKLQQYDAAISHAVKVTELEPNDPFSFTQLSVIYQRCGKIPEAEDAMARARMMQVAAGGH
jgi:Tfp pilus assembly protein PilF